MNIENSLVGNHGDLLRLRSKKAEILAGNIANANTPGYKARDFDISSAIKSSNIDIKITKTNRNHVSLDGDNKIAIDLMYRAPNQTSFDGNTVEVDNEIRILSENNLRYQYSLKYSSDKIKLIKDILRDI